MCSCFAVQNFCTSGFTCLLQVSLCFTLILVIFRNLVAPFSHFRITMQLIVIKHSILSGLFAAFAALFGKLGTTPSISRSVLSTLLFIPDNYFEYTLWIAQCIAVGLMFASNAIMWSQYSLALAFSQVTLHVTVINTVSNFIFTAMIGRILFGETISLMWAAGITCILVGIVLLKEQESQLSNKQQHSD